jgi:dephospho-CoA kinase
MKVIGLAGGIGSGKSTVAQFLAGLGAVVLDLDKAGHEVYKRGGEAYKKLVAEFGDEILAEGGEIDRSKLGKIVFGGTDALKRLNGIVHPAIDKVVEDKLAEYRAQGVKVVVLEAAAMLENEKSWLADEIWVTVAPEAEEIKRTKDRPGYNEEVVRKRIKSQMANEERIKIADVVIDNSGTPEELKQKVSAEWAKLQERL